MSWIGYGGMGFSGRCSFRFVGALCSVFGFGFSPLAFPSMHK